jgi:myosin-1
MRYKMLSKKTWPNVRSSDEEGVRTILTEHGLIKDATFGKTKIFIQSPETLFQLVNILDNLRLKLMSVIWICFRN